MIPTVDNAGFVSRALRSPEVTAVLNKAFGRRNERLKNKRFKDILKLLEPFIFPLPTVEDLNEIYRRLPGVMVHQKEVHRGAGAGLINFRLGQDGQVAFDLIVYNKNFDLKQTDLDVCMELVLRAVLSMYCFAHWQSVPPTPMLTN